MPSARAVTFDFGQTLAELDTAMLATRLAERAVHVPAACLDTATLPAWAAYNAAIRAGHGGHPWKVLMRTMLTEAGTPADAVGPLVDWLWTEQPRRNLWRRPIPGMIDLVLTLRDHGVPVGVVSNSEGRLAALIDELGWSHAFGYVADSGVLGIEKPDPRIFHRAAEALGVAPAEVVHVGDARAADHDGALAAGMRAVLFRGEPPGADTVGHDPARSRSVEDPVALRAVFAAWGLLPDPA